MSLDESDLERLAEICERYGIAELDVFGSVPRGEARPDSDLDLLYVLKPTARLGWEIEDLNDELSALFGRRVDLVAKRTLHRRMRASVLAESEPLYLAA